MVSSTITDPQWENTTILSGDPVQRVQELKEQQGLDIVVTGSITLCHTLINAGLVDEYRLFVYPAVQGRGRRLFPDGFELPRLRLLETQSFRRRSHTPSTAPSDLPHWSESRQASAAGHPSRQARAGSQRAGPGCCVPPAGSLDG